MDPSGECECALRAARETKEKAVTARGVGEDLAPFLMLLDGERVLGYLMLDYNGEEGQRLANRKMMMALSLSAATLAIHVAESFVFKARGEDELRHPGRPLDELFAEGDDRVSECLSVFATDGQDFAWEAVQPYRYEGRTVVWDEAVGEQVDRADIGGLIPAQLFAGFAAQASRPFPPLDLRRIGAVLEMVAVTPVDLAGMRPSAN